MTCLPGVDPRLAFGACAACCGHGVLPAPPRNKASALAKWERKAAARLQMPAHKSLPPLPPKPAPPPPPEPVQCFVCAGRGVVPLLRVSTGGAPDELRAGELPLIAIVGGGLGGLACALALQQRGARVAVFERDDSFEARAQGYGLTLQQGGVALRCLGVDLEGVSPPEHISLRADGSLLGRFGRSARSDGRGCAVRPRGSSHSRRAGSAAAPPAAAASAEAEGGDAAGSEAEAALAEDAPAEAAPADRDPSAARRASSAAAPRADARPCESARLRGSRSAFRPANLIVPRQAVRLALLEQLLPGTVRWGHQLVAIEPLPPLPPGGEQRGPGAEGACQGACRGLRLIFRTAAVAAPGGSGHGGACLREEEAALLVGADGLWSAVSEQLDGLLARQTPAPAPGLAPEAGVDGKRGVRRAALPAAPASGEAAAEAEPARGGRGGLHFLGLVVVLGLCRWRPLRARLQQEKHTQQRGAGEGAQAEGEPQLPALRQQQEPPAAKRARAPMLPPLGAPPLPAYEPAAPLEGSHGALWQSLRGEAWPLRHSAGARGGGPEPLPLAGFGLVGSRAVWQTVDGSSRLYAMPFKPARAAVDAALASDVGGDGCAAAPPSAGSRAEAVADVSTAGDGAEGEEEDEDEDEVTMWQLSWPLSEADARALGRAGGEALRAASLERVAGWHQPVEALLGATAADAIVGYPVYDRHQTSTAATAGDEQAGNGSAVGCTRAHLRAVLLGDASHAMSPFKGQGANQALLDALALARALADAGLCARALAAKEEEEEGDAPRRESALVRALLRFEQDMAERAGAKVEGSRRAARVLHSGAALAEGDHVRAHVAEEAEVGRAEVGRSSLPRE